MKLTTLLILLSIYGFSQTADTIPSITYRAPTKKDTLNHVPIDPVTGQVIVSQAISITPIDTAIQARILDFKPLLGLNLDSTMSLAQMQAWIKFEIRDRVGQNVRRITPRVASKIIRGQ